MATPTRIVAYLALFAAGDGGDFFAAEPAGRLLLAAELPNEEKLEVYECGEPTIGSSFVQFDLRFYVVALLFIIFDVEVAFFFPWATVFGKATHLQAVAPDRLRRPSDRRHARASSAPSPARKLSELGIAAGRRKFRSPCRGEQQDDVRLRWPISACFSPC